MEIVDIFEVVEDSLFAVQYEFESFNEFKKCFNQWKDPIYLREFFENNIEDLNRVFWRGISIDDAILKTRKDAKLLEDRLLKIAETGKTDNLETLSTLFEPLSQGKIEKEYEKDKVKGLIRRSWLRIYAVRVDLNLFVISGGAIKLTKTMNDREHLIRELEKINLTRNYLMDDENDELEGFVF